MLSLPGAIPSRGVGTAQIKAIPGRLTIPWGEISTAGWQWHELSKMNTGLLPLPSSFLRCTLLELCFNRVYGTCKPWGLLCALARASLVPAREISDPFALRVPVCYLVLVTTSALPALLAVTAVWYIQASRYLAEELLHSPRQPMGPARLKSASRSSTDPPLYGNCQQQPKEPG